MHFKAFLRTKDKGQCTRESLTPNPSPKGEGSRMKNEE
jgi:hypothetical protein